MKIKVDLPESTIDKVASAELSRLTRENQSLKRKVAKWESWAAEYKHSVEKAREATAKIVSLGEYLQSEFGHSDM